MLIVDVLEVIHLNEHARYKRAFQAKMAAHFQIFNYGAKR